MSAVGGVEVLDLGFIANEAITKYRFVKGAGTGDRSVDMCDSAGEVALGVAMHDVSSDDADENAHVNVRLMGIAVVEAGATVTQYAQAQTDGSGRAIDAAADDAVLGVFLSGGDVGEYVTVALSGPGAQHLVPGT